MLEKYKKKTKIKICAILASLIIGAIATYSMATFALNLPTPALNLSFLRNIEGISTDFSNGIDISPPATPTGSPSQTQTIVPSFTGLNATWLANSNGPLEIPDDTVEHGLMNTFTGLINTGGQNSTFQGSTPLPDLVVHVEPPTSVYAGHPVNFPVTIKNQGTARVNNGSVKTIFRTAAGNDNTCPRAGVPPVTCVGASTWNTATNLQPNETTNMTYVEFDSPGVYSLTACIDTLNAVAEQNEDNNCNAPTTFTVLPLPLTISLASDSPAATDVLPGTTDYIATKFNLTAPAEGSVTVSYLKIMSIATGIHGGGAGFNIRNVKLYEETPTSRTLIPATIYGFYPDYDSTGYLRGEYMNFFSLNLLIPAGTTKKIQVVLDVKADARVGFTNKFGIDAGNASNIISSGGPVLGTPVYGNTFTVRNPELNVSLAANNPATSNIPQGNTAIVTKIDFSAIRAPIAISSIKVTRGGISSDNDLENIQLLDGNTPLGPIVPSLTGGIATFSNLNWTIPVGTPKTLSIKAGVKSTAGISNYFSFGINATADVETSMVKNGSFPITGNSHTIVFGRPDLITENLTKNIANPVVGNVMTFTGTARNQGNSPAGANTARMCLYNETTYDCYAIGNWRVQETTLSQLSNGNSTTITSNAWTASPGPHTLVFCADPRWDDPDPTLSLPSVITESNENNNCSQMSFNVSAPDLVVLSPLTLSATNPVAGTAMTIKSIIKNQGNANAGESTAILQIYKKDANGNLTLQTPASGAYIDTTSATAAGAQQGEKTWYWTPPDSMIGNVRIQVCTDQYTAVTESNENNNCTYTDTTVKKGTLVVTRLSPRPSDEATSTGSAIFNYNSDTRNILAKFTLKAQGADIAVSSINLSKITGSVGGWISSTKDYALLQGANANAPSIASGIVTTPDDGTLKFNLTSPLVITNGQTITVTAVLKRVVCGSGQDKVDYKINSPQIDISSTAETITNTNTCTNCTKFLPPCATGFTPPPGYGGTPLGR